MTRRLLFAPALVALLAACGGASSNVPPVDASTTDVPAADVPGVDAGAPVDSPAEDVPVAVDALPAATDVPAVRCAPGDCGPHGHSHGDHCDCDPGYVDREGCCVPPPACTRPDDALEDNDDADEATAVEGASYSRDGLRVCPADVDVFQVPLTTGQRVEINLRFTHASGDVDAYLFNPGTTDFSHATPVARGVGTVDNERFSFTARRDGGHLLVVSGYDGAENDYALTITVTGP